MGHGRLGDGPVRIQESLVGHPGDWHSRGRGHRCRHLHGLRRVPLERRERRRCERGGVEGKDRLPRGDGKDGCGGREGGGGKGLSRGSLPIKGRYEYLRKKSCVHLVCSFDELRLIISTT